ncbi:MAG: hypothetical protein IJ814_05250 [Paludibacteraceae bacterium]|nr:hypothetical protein [Paludibacteraceae bacterium]
MKNTTIILTLTGCLLLCGCDVLERKHQAGVAVELNGHLLYQSTLDSLTMGMDSTERAATIEQYIRQWAEDMLVSDGARSQRNDDIEKMVEDYRHTLYIQAYAQRLISKRMPKNVADSTIEALYNQLGNRLLLKESIVKGIVVVVPNEAPGLADLRDWLRIANGEKVEKKKADSHNRRSNGKGKRNTQPVVELSEEEMRSEALDNIEKFAYQNASGYELFTEEWKTASELLLLLPFERNELDGRMKKDSQIEISDSINTYLLQVTDKHLQGELMPLDYARPQLEEYILSTRQADFLRSERIRLYEEAVEKGKVKFYE